MSAPSAFIRILEWLAGRSASQEVVTFAGDHLFNRFVLLWPDEYIYQGKHYYRPPWWRPFNILLHCWNVAEGVAEELHDHPRWSITICLAGRIVEVTPWGERLLKPGSIVFRTHKAIHAFRAPDGYAGETWTLFIVGQRDHPQNTYAVTPQGFVTAD